MDPTAPHPEYLPSGRVSPRWQPPSMLSPTRRLSAQLSQYAAPLQQVPSLGYSAPARLQSADADFSQQTAMEYTQYWDYASVRQWADNTSQATSNGQTYATGHSGPQTTSPIPSAPEASYPQCTSTSSTIPYAYPPATQNTSSLVSQIPDSQQTISYYIAPGVGDSSNERDLLRPHLGNIIKKASVDPALPVTTHTSEQQTWTQVDDNVYFNDRVVPRAPPPMVATITPMTPRPPTITLLSQPRPQYRYYSPELYATEFTPTTMEGSQALQVSPTHTSSGHQSMIDHDQTTNYIYQQDDKHIWRMYRTSTPDDQTPSSPSSPAESAPGEYGPYPPPAPFPSITDRTDHRQGRPSTSHTNQQAEIGHHMLEVEPEPPGSFMYHTESAPPSGPPSYHPGSFNIPPQENTGPILDNLVKCHCPLALSGQGCTLHDDPQFLPSAQPPRPSRPPPHCTGGRTTTR